MANLKLVTCKCFFVYNEEKYLGHVVSKDGVALDPKNIQAIERTIGLYNQEVHKGFPKACWLFLKNH